MHLVEQSRFANAVQPTDQVAKRRRVMGRTIRCPVCGVVLRRLSLRCTINIDYYYPKATSCRRKDMSKVLGCAEHHTDVSAQTSINTSTSKDGYARLLKAQQPPAELVHIPFTLSLMICAGHNAAGVRSHRPVVYPCETPP